MTQSRDNEIESRLKTSPEIFLSRIPKDPKQNVLFRADLHEYLATASDQARNDFVEMCRLKPQISFKTMFWTFQPKATIKPCGILPFITWDWQDEKIEEINYYMLLGGLIKASKSREVGGTWIIEGCGLNLWQFTPNNIGLMTSRKEELVDKKGDTNTLFWKLDFMVERLPDWVRPAYDRKERLLKNLWNHSVITGEATVENVGKSGRVNWVFCDEFPAVKHSDAAAMERALTDTAACRIYLGTCEYRSHPHSEMGRRKGTVNMAFGWWLHPFKAQGLYWSPDINVIIIEDIEYYRNLAPKVFDKYQKGKEIKYSELEQELVYQYPELKISFVADGGRPNKPQWRSPWYDNENETRTALDAAVNLDMDEIGSGDTVFSAITIQQMQEKYVRNPDKKGEILFELNDNKISHARFLDGGKGRLKWWGELCGSRPPQNHNYVMGCDISLGQGQSNSVCSVFDVDTRMKVGSWSDSYILPEQFAEQVYALGLWLGGLSSMPFLNFEANGIGQVFLKRIRELGYSFIYKTTTEKKGFHQKLTTLGWTSNTNSKIELLTNYNAALTATFRSRMNSAKFINPDEDALREAQDYIFNGGQIVLSRCIEDSGGAKAAHGDRVIADALCNLAAQDQPKAFVRFEEKIMGTPAWYQKESRRMEVEKYNRTKIWLNC
jgi:hypothetical protein